jgi:predicted amidohydrolase YtcJ
LLILLAAATAAAAPADSVYRHGYVYTVDAKDGIASAVAVSQGRIVYVGTDAGAARYIGKSTQVVDLQGRMLMPGLVDGHMHPLSGGAALLKCNLAYEALTIAQFQQRIQACLDKTREHEPDGWLEVVGWFSQNMVPAGTTTTAATLDVLNTKRPIVVQNTFGHTSLVNSRALQLGGITAQTPDPLGGKIARDAHGNATGILEDAAQEFVDGKIPKPSAADQLAAARATLTALAQQGVTTFMDAGASADSMTAYTALQKEGALTVRAHFAPVIQPPDGRDPPKAIAAVKALATKFDQGPIGPQPGITVRNTKLFLDGVITAPAFTGAVIEPYWVNHGTEQHPQWGPGTDRGPPVYFPAPILAQLLIGLAEAGLDPHMHADGDGAVRAGLDAAAELRRKHPSLDARVAIAHNELVHPADYPRYAALNVNPVLSLQWGKPAADTVEGARDILGPARFRIMEPSGFLHAAGARIAYGSDWPVDPLNEWFALKVGVTRTNVPGSPPQWSGRLGDDVGLSRQTALRAITMNSSYQLHQEALTGSIEAGKLADFIVLDRNVMKIAPEDIANVKVLRTVVGGKTVYEAK